MEDTNDLPLDFRTTLRTTRALRATRNWFTHQDALCQRINLGEILFRKCLIPHRDARGAVGILFIEVTPVDYPYAEGLEVIRSDHLKPGILTPARVNWRCACNAERTAGARSA